MRHEGTLAETYDACIIDGMVVPQEDVAVDQVRGMFAAAKSRFDFAKKIKELKDADWNTVYDCHYSVLHLLAEAFVRLDKVKISNHKCLFAYVCCKHPELEFEWEFFEKARSKRNALSYYGSNVSRQDWKDSELQFTLYISHMIKVLEERLDCFSV